MREEEFTKFLNQDNNIISKDKAVKSRLSKARSVEKKFNIDLDYIVKDDNRMFDLLVKIKDEFSDSNGAKQNAVRKYYTFVNKRTFPTLDNYQKSNK